MSGQLSVEGWNRLKKLEADNERLREVARWADGFERAYQRSLGSASAFDVQERDNAQVQLRMALNAYEQALTDEGAREDPMIESLRHGSDNGMGAYLLLEASLCICDRDKDETCTCGWDDHEEDE